MGSNPARRAISRHKDKAPGVFRGLSFWICCHFAANSFLTCRRHYVLIGSAKRASACRLVPRIVTVCRRRLPYTLCPVSKVKVQLPLLRCFTAPLMTASQCWLYPNYRAWTASDSNYFCRQPTLSTNRIYLLALKVTSGYKPIPQRP